MGRRLRLYWCSWDVAKHLAEGAAAHPRGEGLGAYVRLEVEVEREDVSASFLDRWGLLDPDAEPDPRVPADRRPRGRRRPAGLRGAVPRPSVAEGSAPDSPVGLADRQGLPVEAAGAHLGAEAGGRSCGRALALSGGRQAQLPLPALAGCPSGRGSLQKGAHKRESAPARRPTAQRPPPRDGQLSVVRLLRHAVEVEVRQRRRRRWQQLLWRDASRPGRGRCERRWSRRSPGRGIESLLKMSSSPGPARASPPRPQRRWTQGLLLSSRAVGA